MEQKFIVNIYMKEYIVNNKDYNNNMKLKFTSIPNVGIISTYRLLFTMREAIRV